MGCHARGRDRVKKAGRLNAYHSLHSEDNLLISADSFANSRAVSDQFRVLAANGCRNMTVPANREVRGQYGRDLFGSDCAPLDGVAVRTEQRGLAIQPVNLSEFSSTRDATLSPVPVRQYVADQTAFGRKLDLKQALLTAARALGPSRAGPQTKVWMAESGCQSGVRCIYFDRSGFSCFRAGDDTLSTEPDVGSDNEWDHKVNGRDAQD
jgi:hypothetical protein